VPGNVPEKVKARTAKPEGLGGNIASRQRCVGFVGTVSVWRYKVVSHYLLRVPCVCAHKCAMRISTHLLHGERHCDPEVKEVEEVTLKMMKSKKFA
jgi:hypothetical protein